MEHEETLFPQHASGLVTCRCAGEVHEATEHTLNCAWTQWK